MNEDLREKFLKAYANLPLQARKEIVAVFEESGVKQPLTWEVIYLEVLQKTERSGKILKKLGELSLI